MHDEVEVDPSVSPELEAGQISGRCAGPYAQAAAAAKRAEHARCRGKGRDDDVGSISLDQPPHASCPKQREAGASETTERSDAGEEPIEKAEDPRSNAQLPAVRIPQEEAKHAPEPDQRVADQDLDVGTLAHQLARERSSRCDVTLADLGRQDDDAQFRLAPRLIPRKQGSTTPGHHADDDAIGR